MLKNDQIKRTKYQTNQKKKTKRLKTLQFEILLLKLILHGMIKYYL